MLRLLMLLLLISFQPFLLAAALSANASFSFSPR